MLGIQHNSRWQSITNPFLNIETSEAITGQVSGRSADITEIITQDQNAIILAGAPDIGKSSLMRYLQRSPTHDWSWRNELAFLRDQLKLEDIHFVQMNLAPLEDIEDAGKLLERFIAQSVLTLQSVLPQDQPDASNITFELDLRGLRKLLRSICALTPGARYFLMIDAINRLRQPGTRSFPLQSMARTDQERGLALLDHCGAIRTLVDLLDEFKHFGVILSIESLPRSRVEHQFSYVSADLARFATMTLQAFAWNDVMPFLEQEAENFGISWASRFRELGASAIFSQAEQVWLREQAGTHPYLLHQFCIHAFEFKRERAIIYNRWAELEESDKKQLIERLHERLNTFLASLWKKRLQEALETGASETKSRFYEFTSLLAQKSTDDVIDATLWDYLGSELRYILYSEGIVRYDPFQPVHYPGSVLRAYLVQKAQESDARGSSVQQPVSSTTASAGRWLVIQRPEAQTERVSLSELEYRLIKALLRHPERSTDQELMREAWNRLIERGVFTQRMFQLRKKLRNHSAGIEIIENRYGGQYLLTHPEWLSLS